MTLEELVHMVSKCHIDLGMALPAQKKSDPAAVPERHARAQSYRHQLQEVLDLMESFCTEDQLKQVKAVLETK